MTLFEQLVGDFTLDYALNLALVHTKKSVTKQGMFGGVPRGMYHVLMKSFAHEHDSRLSGGYTEATAHHLFQNF